mgnify:FL=1
MKKNFLLFLFVIGFGKFISAQEKSSDERKNVITFSVLSAALSPPRWTFGYIYKLNERYWIGSEIGYGSYHSIPLSHKPKYKINEDYQLFEIRPEFFINLSENKRVKHLISSEFFYIHHTDHLENGEFYRKDDQNFSYLYSYDTADYKREKYGINLNYNVFIQLHKGLILMPKVGLGVKNRNVKYSNITNLESVDTRIFDYFMSGLENHYKKEGSSTDFNLNLNFKIGYQF